MIKRMLLISLLILLAGCDRPEVGVMKFSPGVSQLAVHADKIAWKPCPGKLARTCKITILEGHPGKPDLFTVRFDLNTRFYMPAHTHPKDERVTVLKGKMQVAFGAKATRKDAKTFGPGDYYVNARGKVHQVWVSEDAIIQITGIGPWQLNFVGKRKRIEIPKN